MAQPAALGQAPWGRQASQPCLLSSPAPYETY